MRELTGWLLRVRYWLAFVLLEGVAVGWLLATSRYHRATVADAAVNAGLWVKRARHSLYRYLWLIEENRRLTVQMAEVLSRASSSSVEKGWEGKWLPARVLSMSMGGLDNSLVIDVGRADSVDAGMGVLCAGGVVGITEKCGRHWCRILPLVSLRSRVTVRVGRRGVLGTLVWRGGSQYFAVVEDILPGERVYIGDSVFTAGIEDIFPAGWLVGVVVDIAYEGEQEQNLRVALSTPWSALSNVLVFKGRYVEDRF